MKNKITSTIAGASVFITLVGLVSKSLGLLRESIFANYFGLSVAYDLFLVSIVFPVTINSMIIYIAQNIFIPKYHRKKSDVNQSEGEYLNYYFWTFMLGGAVLTLLFLVFSEPILKLYIGNLDESNFITASNIFKIYIVTFTFNSGYSVLAAYSHAILEFTYPILSQLFLNLLAIISVILFSSDIGVYSIPIGYLAGNVAQFFFVLNRLKPNLSLSKIRRFKKAGISIINSSLFIVVVIEILGQMYLLIDRTFYKSVDQGGIAALNYSFSFVNLPLAIIAVAFGNAMFPTLSKNSIENNELRLSELINKFISINIFMFTFISAVYILFGDIFIRILFERGMFTIESTFITYEVLVFYSLGLIFISSYTVLNKILYSYNKLKTLLLVVSSGVVAKIMFSIILVGPLRQVGLSLSTSISYCVLFIFACIAISYLVKIKFISHFIYESLFMLSTAILCTALVKIFNESIVIRVPVLKSSISIFVFTFFYFFSAILLKIKSISILRDFLNRIPIVAKIRF